MCLSIKSGPHFASTRMTVYKTVRENNVSAVQQFPYSPNQEYTADKPLEIETQVSVSGLDTEQYIHEGFHSFQPSGVRLHDRSIVSKDAGGMVLAFVKFGDKLVKFTIPKGAMYYRGQNGDIVSDKILSGDLKEIDPETVIAPYVIR